MKKKPKKPKKPLSMIELFNLFYKVKKARGKPKKSICNPRAFRPG